MNFFEWKPSYSVNVDDLDSQHKKLITLVNSLNEAMTQGKGKDVLNRVLNDLAIYAEVHFNNEEKLFAKYQYPDAKAHIQVHNDFRSKVLEIKKKADSGNLLVTVELLTFLQKWIEDHILKIDKKYSEFFNSKGLS